MYSELNDKQKTWILSLSGADLYAKCCELHKSGKMSPEKLKQSMSFWLNEHGVKYHEDIVKITTLPAKTTGQSVWFVNNLAERKDFWEKYANNELQDEVKKIFN